MSWLSRKKSTEQKSNPVGSALLMTNQYVAPTRNLVAFIVEGYKQNVIVHRCVSQIARACANLEIEVKVGDKVLEKHWIYDLLKKPNPTESGSQFIKHLFTDYLIGGSMFPAAFPDKGKPAELWGLDPRYMKVKPGIIGLPASYEFDNGQAEGKKTFLVNQINGDCQVLHFKNYNPLDQWTGLAPMEAAALSADVHNQGLRWNYALLKNGARPSGIVKFKGSPAPEVVARLTEFFKKRWQGASNAGEIPMLTNDADWQSVDSSPKDMDYINTLKEAAKYIAAVYGVPLPLVDNDASTFNNMDTAKEMLYSDTVIPLFQDFLASFGGWLKLRSGDKEDFTLCINKDNIDALEKMRAERFKRMGQGIKDGIISPDEARESVGYTPKGGIADSLFIPSSAIPIDMAGDILLSDNTDPNADPEADPTKPPKDEPPDDANEDEKSFYKSLRRLNYSRREIMGFMRPLKGKSNAAPIH